MFQQFHNQAAAEIIFWEFTDYTQFGFLENKPYTTLLHMKFMMQT